MNFWTGDAIATGLELAATQVQSAKHEAYLVEKYNKLAQQYDEVSDANAGNLAEKIALRNALKELNPNHPLVANTALLERLRSAGKKALSLTNNWDAVREVGNTFKY
jgi:hypothetical protein